MAARNTRKNTKHSIFGQPRKMSLIQLPTCEDVYRAYLYYLNEGMKSNTLLEISKIVANDVQQVYAKASIPTIEYKSIVFRIKRL